MRSFVAAASAALLVCAALTGCSTAGSGGGTPEGTAGATGAAAVTPSASTAAPPANACALATEADATTVLGSDPGAGLETDGQRRASSCSYGQSPSLLVVNLVPADGKASFDHLMSDPAAGSATQLAGIGDGAFLVSKSGTVGLDFYRGDTFVGIVIVTSGGAPVDKATALAKTLAQRL